MGTTTAPDRWVARTVGGKYRILRLIARGGMGIDAADFNGSGQQSLVIGNFDGEMVSRLAVALDAGRGERRRHEVEGQVVDAERMGPAVAVALQERGRLEGAALHVSTFMKFILYSTLLFAAVYWGVKGDFLDFWDAFLWLVAFVFIELNVFEWRAEELEEAAPEAAT